MLTDSEIQIYSSSQVTQFFKIKHPKYCIPIQVDNNTFSAATLISVGLLPTVRPNKTQNPTGAKAYHDFTISTVPYWRKRSTPEFAVLGTDVYRWPQGVLVVGGEPLEWKDIPLVGMLKEGVLIAVPTSIPPSEDLDEQKVYKVDPHGLTEDGHHIDLTESDPAKRFIVPNNFAEFYDRYPKHLQRWVMRKLGKTMVDSDVLDWEQSLCLHLLDLPENSKTRQPGYNGLPEGCKDRIQCFSPERSFGCTPARFFHWLNGILSNFFCTANSKQQRNPICRMDTLSYGVHTSDDPCGVADDVFIHQHSPTLAKKAAAATASVDSKIFLSQFEDFILENADQEGKELIEVIEAVGVAGTYSEAQKSLGVSDNMFTNFRKRIMELREEFLVTTKE